MKIFTGISDQQTDNLTLYDFVNSTQSLSVEQTNILQNTPITPYVRAGGSLTSGTAASFVNSSNLNFNEKNDLTHDEQAAFDSGVYGRKHNLVETDEANSRAWSVFQSANNAGQIVYLSSGFVSQN
jgi:ABC-type phosphate transport system substrate-binding protein